MKKQNISDERALEIVAKAVKDFKGDGVVLESAIGALFIGQAFGWHALRMVHSGRTFKRYEEVLQIKFREELLDRTEQSRRIAGIKMVDKLGKFWQVVTAGRVPARDAAQVSKASGT
jgi:hypothetical protein